MKGFNGMSYDDFDDVKYSISFRLDKDNTLSYSFQGEYEDDTPWTEYLQRFVEFLEGAGFMGVRERVSVEDSPFLEGHWFGPVHEAENDVSVKEQLDQAMRDLENHYNEEDYWK